jgi:hypothetical protein
MTQAFDKVRYFELLKKDQSLKKKKCPYTKKMPSNTMNYYLM